MRRWRVQLAPGTWSRQEPLTSTCTCWRYTELGLQANNITILLVKTVVRFLDLIPPINISYRCALLSLFFCIWQLWKDRHCSPDVGSMPREQSTPSLLEARWLFPPSFNILLLIFQPCANAVIPPPLICSRLPRRLLSSLIFSCYICM